MCVRAWNQLLWTTFSFLCNGISSLIHVLVFAQALFVSARELRTVSLSLPEQLELTVVVAEVTETIQDWLLWYPLIFPKHPPPRSCQGLCTNWQRLSPMIVNTPPSINLLRLGKTYGIETCVHPQSAESVKSSLHLTNCFAHECWEYLASLPSSKLCQSSDFEVVPLMHDSIRRT